MKILYPIVLLSVLLSSCIAAQEFPLRPEIVIGQYLQQGDPVKNIIRHQGQNLKP